MSVKIFDTHTLQTDVLCNTNNRTNKGRRRQKSTGLLIPVPHCRCCPSRPQLLPVRLCQSLPPQPYALEVSNREREGLVIASRQPQLGGGDGQRWMMTTMAAATAAVDNHCTRLRLSPSWRCRWRSAVRRRPTHGPSRGLASSSSSLQSPSDHRNGHYDMIIAGGGAVGSALARMLLDDTTAASASAPDSDGSLRRTRVVVIVFIAVAVGPRQKSTVATRLPS